MIVPEHWAEVRLQHRKDGKQVTVRRFGWSDISPAEARAMAETRARDALQRVLAGENLPRRDAKQAYGGGDGLPIREQIIRRHGDSVITRNAYGALCINSPDVMFVDIDDPKPAGLIGITEQIIVAAAAIGFGMLGRDPYILYGALALLAIRLLLKLRHRARQRAPGATPPALLRIREFSRSHPDWHLRIYRTPAGYRVLAMHALFDPRGKEAKTCFAALAADPDYARMCRLQNCFRARVSPKPWRVGIDRHLRPRPGVWPVQPEHLPGREKWIRDYEARAAAFSSCSYLETLGSVATHPKAEAVRALHDDLSRALTGLTAA